MNWLPIAGTEFVEQLAKAYERRRFVRGIRLKTVRESRCPIFGQEEYPSLRLLFDSFNQSKETLGEKLRTEETERIPTNSVKQAVPTRIICEPSRFSTVKSRTALYSNEMFSMLHIIRAIVFEQSFQKNVSKNVLQMFPNGFNQA